MIISLTGFMGCGKTTVGKVLARRLEWPFVDLDTYIEEHEGALVREIFASGGEDVFRMVEMESLREVIAAHEDGNLVLSLGGGTIINDSSRELLLGATFCVYLKASASSIRSNLSPEGIAKRPLLAGNGVEELLAKRAPVYASAHQTVDTDGLAPAEVAEEIVKMLNF